MLQPLWLVSLVNLRLFRLDLDRLDPVGIVLDVGAIPPFLVIDRLVVVTDVTDVPALERAIAAVDDPERIVPWLDTGRFPHDGDPMSARDLKMLLDAAETAGLRRFNYHHQGNLSAGEWIVISDKCGTRWDPSSTDWAPPDRLVL